MDNRVISIKSAGRKDFELAMRLGVNKNTIGYRVDNNRLILYWIKTEEMQPLPYTMTVEETTNFVWGWLDKNDPTGGRPDHDGDNDKGFHIYNEAWGHIDHQYQAFLAIEPIWAMYGK